MNPIDHSSPPGFSRREWLLKLCAGFGGIALMDAVTHADDGNAIQGGTHFAPRARRVVMLFMAGAPSHIDLWDEKPELTMRHGQAPPADAPNNGVSFGLENARLLRPVAPYQRYGESGLALSSLLPNLGRCADRLCFLRGIHADNSAHEAGRMQLHTGFTSHGKPALGAWLGYGLGSENRDLPSFVTLNVARTCSGNGFLPASYQGTTLITPSIDGQSAVVPHLTEAGISADVKRRQFDLTGRLNAANSTVTASDSQLDGMIRSMELAFRMQTAATALGDLSQETRATLDLYGVGQPGVDDTARQLLLTRRCLEAGVRCVSVGIGGDWDHHGDIAGRLPTNARSIDQPVAALLTDLEQRGMLDDTLVICGGEFGRTPMFQTDPRRVTQPGRDHNRFGFTMWLAGGGVKQGISFGATDPLGFAAVENRVHIHDLHATVLHLLGLDHERLTFQHAGRNYRLTDVAGSVVHEIIA